MNPDIHKTLRYGENGFGSPTMGKGSDHYIGALQCPRCGWDCTHMEGLFPDNSGEHRQGGFVIAMSCERCDFEGGEYTGKFRFYLHIGEHKGWVFVYTTHEEQAT